MGGVPKIRGTFEGDYRGYITVLKGFIGFWVSGLGFGVSQN